VKTKKISDLTPEDFPALATVSTGDSVTLYYAGDSLPTTPGAVAGQCPEKVSMRQARLALLGAGLLPAVEAALNALPEPQKTQAAIVWEYSAEVQRHFGLVKDMAAVLGMTEEQLDDLFNAAAAIP
jgi:hypothetical protein